MKNTIEKIEMPDDMKIRIVEKCKSESIYRTEEKSMTKNNTGNRFKKTAAVALAAALFICFALGAAAAGRHGFFSDIVNWNGAVIGTQYENAANEIDAEVISAENGVITVSAALLRADAFPYREIENLGIGSYKIVDAEGNAAAEGENTEFAEIANGKAEIKISAEGIAEGKYKLIISSFVGVKKADQPLKIYGEWECEFAV